jgi:phage terminase large subunit GpA-like protein
MIGVDSCKDLLHGQLAIQEPGPGYVHFPSDLPREWFEQLTAEKRIPVRARGGDSMRWVKRRPRNEKLDCRNYALHSAFMLGLDGMKEAAWLRIEAAVQPPPDLFTPAPRPAADAGTAAQTAPDAIHVPAAALVPPPAARAPAAMFPRAW